MWTWPLDNVIWVTTAHRTLEGVADGTCTQVWVWMTNKCRTMMDWRELYKGRDLLQEKGVGGFAPWVGGARILPSWPWWIKPNGNSYPQMKSSFPQIVSPSTSVFLAPTRSSPTPALTVVSSKPSPWTHSLQIHCNGSIEPRSHLSMGPSQKIATLQLLSIYNIKPKPLSFCWPFKILICQLCKLHNFPCFPHH